MPIKGMSPKAVMHKEMHEFKHGELHSGSKKGPVVKSRKQAIAIGLSEERKAGGHVPKKHHEHAGHNPVHDGYGAGNQHTEATGFGEAIGGGEHGKHKHDKNMHHIAGGEKRGEHESKLRSQDNPRSDAKQTHGRRTGEDTNRQVEDRSMEHHIAGGEHGHHEHGSGKAEHHPGVDHREPHRFRGGRVEGAHGFGHSVANRDGHHRLSGHSHGHRIGKR